MFGNVPKTHSALAHQSSKLSNQAEQKEHLIQKNNTEQKTSDNSNERQFYEKIILNKDQNLPTQDKKASSLKKDSKKEIEEKTPKKDFLKLLNII